MREKGYYMVNFRGFLEPAQWTGNTWRIIGSDKAYVDSQITSIGCRIIMDYQIGSVYVITLNGNGEVAKYLGNGDWQICGSDGKWNDKNYTINVKCKLYSYLS